MKKGLRLWAVLALTFIVAMLVTVSIFYGLLTYQSAKQIQKKEEQLLISLGRQLAIEQQVIQTLTQNVPSETIETYAKNVGNIHHLDFVVLMNMDGIRLTHPDENMIGKHFIGGDEAPALAGHEHVSISQGTLGESLRGFVPVYDEDGKQVGVVALGITLTSLSTLVKNSKHEYTMMLLISTGFGLTLAVGLSYYLKRQMYNLEPKEIARLLEERNAMLEETNDAILVIDLDKHILLANISAKDMYHYQTGQINPVGQSITAVLLDADSVDFERKTEQVYQQNGQDYLFSSSPISVKDKKIGYVVFLRNATETLFVMDQLANTTAYATSLQSQSHEFMNKLHVIYGLVDLEAYEELNIYLKDIIQPEKEFAHRLAILVKEPVFAGFLIGERQKFAERKTNLWIEIFPEIPASQHKKQPMAITNLYRFIHHVLLQRKLPIDMTMTIDYNDHKLTTIYTLTDIKDDVDDMRQAFQTAYFDQLLKEVTGTFDILNHPSFMTISLTTAYTKES